MEYYWLMEAVCSRVSRAPTPKEQPVVKFWQSMPIENYCDVTTSCP